MTIALLLAATAAVAAPPPSALPPPAPASAPRAPDTCIETVGQPDWVPLDDHTLLVTSGVHRFKVETDTCPPLHRPFPTVTTEVLGGGSICAPEDVRLHVAAGGDVAPIYCSIRSITPITAEAARALDAHRR